MQDIYLFDGANAPSHLTTTKSMSVYFTCIHMQLNDLETSQDSRKLFASGREIGTVPISKEEKAALRSDIQEQEVLLQGYQKVSMQ